MGAYLLHRLVHGAFILFGVNVLTFMLFFFVNSPDDIARRILGDRNVSPALITAWKREHGYHLPKLYNTEEKGIARFTQTIFYQKSVGLMGLDFGRSDRENYRIGPEIRRRMGPSLAFTLPTFVLALYVEIVLSMLVALYRATYMDGVFLLASVGMMSIATMFYIICGQVVVGLWLKLAPISGYGDGLNAVKFLIMPVAIGILSDLGSGIRFNRTVFLEELGKDYVRTARAKGLSEPAVLFVHVLKNAMIPILTSVSMAIPFLFTGSLITESFFAIPGLGSFMLDAIQAQDFAVVRAMVYLGSVLYIIGQLVTDVAYVLVDPRVRLS